MLRYGYLSIIVILVTCFANAVQAAAPTKADVPWAVYLPTGPTDTAGSADEDIKCTGSDINGWRTFMVIDAVTKLPVTLNADLYAGTVPKVSRADINKPSTDTGYILIEFLYIDPFVTPSKDLSTCHRFDGTDFLFGAHEYELAYRPYEKTIRDGLTPYWISTYEVQQKTWLAMASGAGDLTTNYPGDAASDIIDYLSVYGVYPGNNQLGLILPAADYSDPEMAMHTVTYADVEGFCGSVKGFYAAAGVTIPNVRIPNEREWEYAARGAINLYAPKDVVYGGGDWGIHDPSTDDKLSISDVFAKTYHPTDIPYTLIDEIVGKQQTGVDMVGNPVIEDEIVHLRFEITPELETNKDFKFVLGQDTKYDKRYPARFVPLKTFIKRNRSLDIVNLGKNKVGDCYFSCDEDGVDDTNHEVQEYYPDEQGLARAVQGLYMPVDVNGHYAAEMSGGLYKYNEALVDHFELVGVSGTTHNAAYADTDIEYAIWPRNHGPNTTTSVPAPGMTPFNTVLTYFTYQQFESDVVFKGRPMTVADLSGTAVADARAKLQAEVRAYAFPNSPTGNEAVIGGTVFISERSNIGADVATVKSMTQKYGRNAVGGDSNHKWHYVYTKYDGGNHGDRHYYDVSTAPINDFAAHEKPSTLAPSLNNWSLVDICGNVAELCIPNDSKSWAERWNGTSDYASHVTGNYVVTRGGSWNSPGTGVRFAARRPYNPNMRSPEVGFRLIIEP